MVAGYVKENISENTDTTPVTKTAIIFYQVGNLNEEFLVQGLTNYGTAYRVDSSFLLNGTDDIETFQRYAFTTKRIIGIICLTQ